MNRYATIEPAPFRNSLTRLLWTVANFILFGALARRRRLGWMKREFERLSLFRSFRREYLRRRSMRVVNADPALRNLPRRVRREMARTAGNFNFRRERGLVEITSRSARRRGVRQGAALLPVLLDAWRRGARQLAAGNATLS